MMGKDGKSIVYFFIYNSYASACHLSEIWRSNSASVSTLCNYDAADKLRKYIITFCCIPAESGTSWPWYWQLFYHFYWPHYNATRSGRGLQGNEILLLILHAIITAHISCLGHLPSSLHDEVTLSSAFPAFDSSMLVLTRNIYAMNAIGQTLHPLQFLPSLLRHDLSRNHEPGDGKHTTSSRPALAVT